MSYLLSRRGALGLLAAAAAPWSASAAAQAIAGPDADFVALSAKWLDAMPSRSTPTRPRAVEAPDSSPSTTPRAGWPSRPKGATRRPRSPWT